MITSPRTRKIASSYLLQGSSFVERPLVEVDATGRILSVGEWVDVDSCCGVEFYAGVMVPGFVNAHCHLELSHLLGAFERGCGFSAFAAHVGEQRDLASEEEQLLAARRADIEMQRCGVVAVGDVANSDRAESVKGSSSITYRTFCEIFGLRHSATHQLRALPSGISSYTPHSLYSLCDGLFGSVVKAGEGSTHACVNGDPPLSIHFMESPDEQELFEGRGGLYRRYCEEMGLTVDFMHYGSPAERLVALVPRHRRLILVHNTCITQRDIDIVMDHFRGGVHWVVCPRSNSYITGLTPPYELLRANGLDVAIGTDSLSSNTSLSPLDEVATIEGVGLGERLDWATRGGARALGFDDLGEITVGKRPAINILSGIDFSRMELTQETILQQVVKI